jgi:hypothetical protein
MVFSSVIHGRMQFPFKESAEMTIENAANLLLLLEKEPESPDVREYRQVYFEHRRDYFFKILEDNPDKKMEYLPEIEQCYAKIQILSETLHKENDEEREFTARYGRSLQRGGHLKEKFYPENDLRITHVILKLYLEENRIFKSLYDFSPEYLT